MSLGVQKKTERKNDWNSPAKWKCSHCNRPGHGAASCLDNPHKDSICEGAKRKVIYNQAAWSDIRQEEVGMLGGIKMMEMVVSLTKLKIKDHWWQQQREAPTVSHSKKSKN